MDHETGAMSGWEHIHDETPTKQTRIFVHFENSQSVTFRQIVDFVSLSDVFFPQKLRPSKN